MTLAGTYDQAWLKHYEDADGNYPNWNGNDQYNKNPYWDLYKNSNTSEKDVFRFTGKAIWNINKHLKLQGTIGTDINSMNFRGLSAPDNSRNSCRKDLPTKSSTTAHSTPRNTPSTTTHGATSMSTLPLVVTSSR